MAQRISDDDLAARLESLFSVDEKLPCPKGTALLRVFVDARPSDFTFLKVSDLADLRNSACAGIPKCGAFSVYCDSGEQCNA